MRDRMTRLKRALIIFMLIGIGLFSTISFASMTKPLPKDQAFVLSTSIDSNNIVSLKWNIAPGYYLYRKHLHISAKPNVIADIRYPQTELKRGPNHTRNEVYLGKINIPIYLKSKLQKQQFELNVAYQGCSEKGFCYPPMQKNISLSLKNTQPVAKAVTKGVPVDQGLHRDNGALKLSSLLTDQNGVQTLLHTNHFGLMVFLFVGLGLLLAFTPCVLPMIPILTSIIVGQKGVMTAKKALLLSCTYVMGMSITYAIAGLLVALLGSSLQVWLQKPWIIITTSGLFVLLALSLFGFYELRLPRRWHNHVSSMSNQQEGGTYVGVFFMGVLSTLIVSPCVTAPLVGVLMYIAQTGDLALGAGALFAMGIGMGIPLVLIGISAEKWLPKSGPWMEAVKKVFGIFMLGMAIWLLSRIVSATTLLILWGFLLICIALFLGIYLPRVVRRRKLHGGLGFVFGLSGMLLMLGGVSMPDVVNKWVNTNAAAPSFIVVHDVKSLNKQLSLAQAQHQPVILDFYADWCESCVSMDRHVFGKPDVQRKLSNYVLLRADLSANSEKDEALLKNYEVIAPPTVLFFDPTGREMNAQRIIGEVGAKEFLARLHMIGSSF